MDRGELTVKLCDRPTFLNPPPSIRTSKESSPRGSEAGLSQVKVGVVSSSGVVLVSPRGLEGGGGTAAVGAGAGLGVGVGDGMGVGVGIGINVKESDALVVVESKVNWSCTVKLPAAVTGVCQAMAHVIVPGPGMVLGTVEGTVSPPVPITEATVTPLPRSKAPEFRGRDLLGGAPGPVMVILADDKSSEAPRVAEAVRLIVPPRNLGGGGGCYCWTRPFGSTGENKIDRAEYQGQDEKDRQRSVRYNRLSHAGTCPLPVLSL